VTFRAVPRYRARSVLGVIIIAVVFTALAAGIFFAVTRGKGTGVSDALNTQSKAGSRAINLGMVFVYAAFGIAVPLLMITGNHAKASAQVGGVKLNAAEKEGRLLFGEHCAVCHTLSAAAAVGKTGPDLDQLKPSEAVVLHTIANGCLADPGSDTSESCLGEGTMPADVVQGRDAQQVAAFVSKVAGH
jgi:mono/diheme cytochrome c family protein